MIKLTTGRVQVMEWNDIENKYKLKKASMSARRILEEGNVELIDYKQ